MTATGIDENGALLVKDDEGNEEAIISGEVSVRGVYGYV
jgi:BirA family biotin operon repressor/biotin-[acetyl-CoA-carboxylase] ligase